ncbi:MAG: response regulator [Treponema sp.]|nr:response regulator [Candidatus Treponema caballi]
MNRRDTPLRRLLDWCIVIFIFAFTIAQLFSNIKFSTKYNDYVQFADTQVKSIDAVYEYLETVNSLSADMCQYAFSGDLSYINDYFSLLNGPQYSQNKEILRNTNNTIRFSETVEKEADAILERELYIIKLVAVSGSIPDYQMDVRLRTCELTDEDAVLSSEQLRQRAGELAFCEDYRNAKSRFGNVLEEYTDDLVSWNEVIQAEYADLIRIKNSFQQTMLLLTGIMMFLIIILLYRQMTVINKMLSAEKQYKDALITDSIGVFEVNLTEDTVESILSEKKNLISNQLKKWNMTIPCPFSELLAKIIPSLPPADADVFERFSSAYFINQFNDNNRFITRESWYSASDERHLFLRSSVLLSRNIDRECISALIVIRDITSEKLESEKQQQLVDLSLRSGQQYLDALRTDSIGIYEANITCGRIESIISDTPDHKIARFFESVGINLPGKVSQIRDAILPLLDEENRKHLIPVNPDYLTNLYKRGVRNQSNEFWITFPDGEKKYLRNTMLLRKEEGSGDIVGIMIIRDGTEEQLEIQNSQMELLHQKASNEARIKFFSNMSHDIRTPLNGIIGMIDLVRHHMDEPDRVRDYIGKIDMSSKHLLSLVNDVLDMGAIESGKLQIVKKALNLNTILDECCVILNSQLLTHDIMFELDAQPLKTPCVLSDALALKKIIMNILSNAVKFTEDGGKITLKTEYSYSFDGTKLNAKFTITDTGVAMDEDYLDKIFDPFSRENCGPRTSFQGTGLGMSIVKEYVDVLGGTISITSSEKTGTQFVVELPLDIDIDNPDVLNEGGTSLIDVKGLNVLLVDDNELNIEIVQMLLEDQGAVVKTASNGQQALDAFTSSPEGYYDAIIMDIMMPVLDGIEATKLLRRMSMTRSDATTIPVIALTANAFASDLKKTEEAGMTAHLAKPIVPNMLMETLTRCCRRG